MEENHKFTDSIITATKTLLKGEIHFVENYNNWFVDVSVSWNNRFISLHINTRKTDLENNFLSCCISKARFFSFIFRSDTYNFSGKKSKYSELLLESVEVQYLMYSKNPTIELAEKSLIFKGGIRKKDFSSLSNVFKIIEILIDRIDALHQLSNSKQIK